MSKEKQIEEMDEMLEIIAKAREEYANDVTDHTENEYIREGLINANYRKQSEGEWLQDFDGDYYCSACGAYPKKDVGKYCPNCGAKMKGE